MLTYKKKLKQIIKYLSKNNFFFFFVKYTDEK